MDDHNIPINVFILEDIEYIREDLVEVYYDIIQSCLSKEEIYSALKMMLNEHRVLTIREILIKDIQNKCEILEETKNE